MHADLAAKLDLANHHANATTGDIRKLCEKVLKYGFNSAFVNPIHITLAKQLLGNKAKVGTAISFPLGQDVLSVKLAAILDAVGQGADELDIVPNIAALLDGNETAYLAEMNDMVSLAKKTKKGVIVKFIIDTGYIVPDWTTANDGEKTQGIARIQQAATLIVKSGADFVKICSGMGPRGARVEDVTVIRKAIGNTARIKAAGGIDTYEEAITLLNAGADRIGTSKAVEIITNNSFLP